MIDPVGFALENFNPIGAWRDRDGDSPVDARGTLVDGTAVAGPEDLTAALTSRSQMFVTNVTEKLLTYALGRALDYRDMPAVRAIVRQAQRRRSTLQRADPGGRAESIRSCSAAAPRRLPLRVAAAGVDMAHSSPDRHLSRRTVLRGAGAALALPLLESMVPAMSAAPAARPRFGAIYFPHGATMSRWTPKDEGARFHLQRDPAAARAVSRAHQRDVATWGIRWPTGRAAPPATTIALRPPS